MLILCMIIMESDIRRHDAAARLDQTIELRVEAFTSDYASGTLIFHDQVVPEPGTDLLVASGLAYLVRRRRSLRSVYPDRNVANN